MKHFLSASLALVLAATASAQTEEKLPPPPPPPPPKVTPAHDKNLPADYRDFLKRNLSVQRVNWNKEQVIIVTKDGKEDRYPLTEAGTKEAEAKYGKLPVAPPPPPPAKLMKTPPPPPTPPSPPKEEE